MGERSVDGLSSAVVAAFGFPHLFIFASRVLDFRVVDQPHDFTTPDLRDDADARLSAAIPICSSPDKSPIHWQVCHEANMRYTHRQRVVGNIIFVFVFPKIIFS
jgi:hypothetical protein